MNTFSAESLAAALAIIGIVIIVSALLSGLIERSGLPQVAVFLALGAALGPFGLRVLDISLRSAALRVRRSPHAAGASRAKEDTQRERRDCRW